MAAEITPINATNAVLSIGVGLAERLRHHVRRPVMGLASRLVVGSGGGRCRPVSLGIGDRARQNRLVKFRMGEAVML